MNDASGEHFFDVAKKVGSTTYLSLTGLEDHVTHLHEADFIQSIHVLLESVGGGVTHEDAFHIDPNESIDSKQFEA